MKGRSTCIGPQKSVNFASVNPLSKFVQPVVSHIVGCTKYLIRGREITNGTVWSYLYIFTWMNDVEECHLLRDFVKVFLDVVMRLSDGHQTFLQVRDLLVGSLQLLLTQRQLNSKNNIFLPHHS